MAWRLCAAVLLVMAAALPLGPAHAGACVASPTHAPQDDADTGADAPDVSEDAVPLPVPPPTPDGDLSLYYWGWLDPALVPGGDANDWYSIELKGEGETVMMGIVSNYTGTYALYMEPFLVSLYGPGDAAPIGTASSGGGGIEFENARGGVFTIRVFIAGGAAPCSTGPNLGDPLHAARNHGVYFGCNPFCVETR